jgi:hypothetical protein
MIGCIAEMSKLLIWSENTYPKKKKKKKKKRMREMRIKAESKKEK